MFYASSYFARRGLFFFGQAAGNAQCAGGHRRGEWLERYYLFPTLCLSSGPLLTQMTCIKSLGLSAQSPHQEPRRDSS